MSSSSCAKLATSVGPSLEAVPAQTGFLYRDLASGESLALGHQECFPAASVIKLAVLLELLHQVDGDRLSLEQRVSVARQDWVGGAGVLFELDPGLELSVASLARLMIVVSDNTASNLLVKLVGQEAVNERIGPVARLGRLFMEPATPDRDNVCRCIDVARWFDDLSELSPPSRLFALETLRRQQFREKIPARLPEHLKVAHKTGELEGVRHDAALVEHPDKPYILVLLTQKGGPAWEVDHALGAVSRVVYDWVCGV